MDESQNQSPEISATIKAIENGMLILETSDDQQLIRWPLNRLPQSVNIGGTISIKLQSGEDAANQTPSTGSITSNETPEIFRQKLLEELIN